MYFRGNWMEDGYQPRKDKINFWCGSGKTDGYRNLSYFSFTLWIGFYYFLERKKNAWILMKTENPISCLESESQTDCWALEKVCTLLIIKFLLINYKIPSDVCLFYC